MYDAIIVGGGPAGLAAAVYFARQKLNFLVLTGMVGGQALWSSDVEDYLGFHLLDGQSLVKRFTEHLADYKDQFEIKEGSLVTGVEKVGQDFRVTTAKESYETRAILIATGTHHRELGVPGEKEYFNKGVTYCATCDAPLFKGKKVFVIGGGNSAMDAALFAEKYASAVAIVSVNPELAGDAVMKAGIQKSKTIRVFTSTKTTKIVGEQFVTGIGLVGTDGVERVESCEGVFIEIGLVPVSEFIHIVKKDKRQQIMVDRQNRTSEPGIFAAGDVTDISQKQIAIAVGEGSKAALELISYLQHRV